MFIKPAQADELGFVADLIAKYVSQGHFSSVHQGAAGQQNLIASFASTCKNGKLSRCTYRGIETVPAEIWLCGRSENVEGFLIAAGIDNKGGSDRELYMVAVAPESLGQGIGKFLTDFFCDRFAEHTLHGQCYPASQQMQQMFLRRGFIQYGKTNGGNFLFLRQYPPHAQRYFVIPSIIMPRLSSAKSTKIHLAALLSGACFAPFHTEQAT